MLYVKTSLCTFSQFYCPFSFVRTKQ